MRCFGQFSDDRICELCGLCNIDEYIDCIEETERRRDRENRAIRVISTTDIGGGRIILDAPSWWDVSNRPEDDRRDR